jgi:hypothetical protein
MVHYQRAALDDEDRAFIQRSSTRMAKVRLHGARRFGKHDRVVCRLAGQRAWASGSIIKLDQPDQDDIMGETPIPYLVKIDPPNARVVCVPMDDNSTVRAEVCFWQHADYLLFALFCKARKQTKSRRFGVGDRVACFVADVTGDDVAWAAGTIRDLNYDAAPGGTVADESLSGWGLPSSDAIVPYRVLLDSGGYVLVHTDEHWLVRDLRLQPAGPRTSPLGHSSMTRFIRRGEAEPRLWTPQQTHFFPRPFQANALATLCTAHRLRTHPPSGVSASLGDLPAEVLLGIIAASAGREQIDHTTCQVRVQSGCEESDCDDE